MPGLHTQTVVVDGASLAMRFAANWLLQSSLLILAGLFIGWFIKRRGSAVQSVVYRTTLLAVLICPLATWGLSLGGVSGWSLDLPPAWNTEAPVSRPAENGTLTSSRAEPSEVETRVQLKNQVRNDAAPRPAVFPFQDVQSPDLLLSQDAELGLPPAEDSPPEVPYQQDDDALAATDSQIARQEISIAAAPVPEPPTISTFGFLAMGTCLLWAMIAAGLLLRLSWAWRQVVRLCQRGTEADASLSAACRDLASMLGISPPKIRYSPYVSSPCLAGLSRATILLPEMEPSAPVRDVLIHELAHLRRRDCHWNLLRQAITAVFFFQPLLWRLGRRLEAASEEVCDDYVVQFGGDRSDYAHQLLDMAERRLAPLPVAGVGILSLKSLLARRVMRVLDTSRSLSTRVGNLVLVTVIVGGLVGTTIVGFVGLGQERRTAIAAQVPDEKPPESTEPVEPQKPLEAIIEKPAAKAESQKPDEIYQGRVVNEKGQPVPGAELYWIRSRVHEIHPAPPQKVASTNANGEFQFYAPAFQNTSPEETASWAYSETILVKAAGHGFALTYPGKLRPEAPAGTGLFQALADAAATAKTSTLRLPAAGNPIRGKLVDIEGHPIAGATVRIRWFNESQERWDGLLDHPKAGEKLNADWRSRVNNLLGVIEPSQLCEVLPKGRTDAQGQFELHDIGPSRLLQLLIEGEGLESTELIVRNEPGETLVIASDPHLRNESQKVFAQEILAVIGPSNAVTGRVLDWENGNPIAGAVVRAFRVHGNRLSSSREREQFATKTDAEGRYQIAGLPIGADNELVAFTTGDLPYIPVAHQVNTTGPSGETIAQDFRLRQGLWAEGRVFDKATDKPFTGEITYFFFANPKWESETPGIQRAFLDGRYWTNTKGEFRVPVLPSRGVLAFRYDSNSRDRDGIDRYPRGQGAEAIDGAEDRRESREIRTWPYWLTPSNYERVAEVNPQSDQKTIGVEMPLVSSQPVVITVVDDQNQPLTGYEAYGASERSGWQRQTKDRFEIADLKPGERRKVFVFDRERNLAGATVVLAGEREMVQIALGQAGRVKGRLVNEVGEPITDASLSVNLEKLWSDEKTAIWADDGGSRALILVDEEGRFTLDGLVPGWKYNAYALATRKWNGEMTYLALGQPFENVEVAAGETKDLGDLALGPPGMKPTKPQASAKAEAEPSREIQGQLTNEAGEPIVGANVTLIANTKTSWEGGTNPADTAVLAQGITDPMGAYRLTVTGVSSKTHSEANLLVRKDGLALAWKAVNLDESATKADFTLKPEEQLRGKLIDVEGQPAPKVRLVIQSLVKREEKRSLRSGIGYRGDASRAPAWIPTVTSDKDGQFTIPGVPPGFGVILEVDGGERFAPENLALSTGLPEQRPERDGTYRSQVKNAKPGEEVTLVLPPAQIFEGQVTYEDTGEPAAFARVSIWASQEKLPSSMLSVFGMADAQGRYRISAKPGVQFGVSVYPQEGLPYLAREMPFDQSISWESGERVKNVDRTLPRGVLVKGIIQAAGSETPIAGATIKYVPESDNNPNDAEDILTGWQAMKVSKDDGTFEMGILPGPGRILVHRPGGNFVLQEICSRELRSGTPGGSRNYAHAIEQVNPQPDAKSLEVRIALQPGNMVKGRIVDEDGKPVDAVDVISRLTISLYTGTWRGGGVPAVRGGEFQIVGLEKDREYPIYFLQPERQLGATAVLKVGDSEPTVVLKPCGKARCRLVDKEGRAVADYFPNIEMVVTPGPYRYDSKAIRAGKVVGDSDFVANIDRRNHGDLLTSDKDGNMSIPALIPGATYIIVASTDKQLQIAKEFQVKSNETLDLGDIVVERLP